MMQFTHCVMPSHHFISHTLISSIYIYTAILYILFTDLGSFSSLRCRNNWIQPGFTWPLDVSISSLKMLKCWKALPRKQTWVVNHLSHEYFNFDTISFLFNRKRCTKSILGSLHLHSGFLHPLAPWTICFVCCCHIFSSRTSEFCDQQEEKPAPGMGPKIC